MTLEKQLEQAKISLAIRPDFNLFDAFRIFDAPALGYVSISDLKSGLAGIGVYASYDELELFFTRYDKNRDGKLRYSEFCDAMCPIDAYYSTMLNRRTSNNVDMRYEPRDGCFTFATRAEFKELWRTHLNVEV
jgi:EF-hand domain pair